MAAGEGCHSPRECANGCSFYGRPETRNLCSKCYRDFCLQDLLKRKEVPATTNSATAVKLETDNVVVSSPVDSTVDANSSPEERREVCGRCSKKVGIMKQFKCRCGRTFYTAHRYPEEHGCPFNFKASGRDLIAKANPAIKADKLERI